MATSQDFVNWVCGPELDPRYLKYILLSELESLFRFAHGTTHQTIYFPEVKAFHVCVPALAEQQRIAALLGALDDKIELNRAMNRTLEDMAQAIFKSWFIDFDGHTDLVDSDLGPIPRGWHVGTLADAIELHDHCRIPLSKRERVAMQGPYPYFGASGMIDHVDRYLFDGKYLLISEDGENLRTRNTPIAFMAHGRFWVNNHAHIVQGRNGFSVEFIRDFFHFLDINAFLTGAVQPKLSQRNLMRIPLIVPPLEQLQHHAALASVIEERIHANNTESQTLAELRDTLLPRLISGELRIPEAEKTVERAL